MTTNLVTSTFKNETAELFIESISEDPYYLTVGKHTEYEPDDQTISTPSNAIHTSITTVYNEMMFGKRIGEDDIIPVIPRYDWESGTIFSQYVHDDEELFTKNFYACVNSGSYYHIYKCLYNNGDANSTVQPTGQDLEPFTSPSDGYIWKYMYSYSSSIHTKFATDDYIPVVANTSISDAATPGTIEVIEVETAGRGYGNHLTSSFRAQDIQINGSDTTYGLTEDASGLNNYYLNCIIRITSGAAINQYRYITGYQVEGGQKKITIEDNFTVTPAPTDTYQIYPAVFVTGDDLETANCVAWAIVDSAASNSISEIEVLDPGEGFRAASAEILSDSSVAVAVDATFSPIISPVLGHGYNAAEELNAHRACVSVKLLGTESNTVPIENDYRTVSIIKAPLFANVHVQIDPFTKIGTFSDAETILNYRDIQLTGTVSVSNTSRNVTGTSTTFNYALEVGDTILVTDGVTNFLSNVSAISNATSFTMASNSLFSNTGCSVSVILPIAEAFLTSSNTTTLVLDDVHPDFKNDNIKVLGRTSYATALMNTANTPVISINGSTVGDYNTFVQLQRITGELSGVTEFIEDEVITQNDSVGVIFSYTAATPDHIYISSTEGNFGIGNNIVGNTSGAEFVPDNKYPGALKVDSGNLIYVENIDPITRASNKSETLKIILEF